MIASRLAKSYSQIIYAIELGRVMIILCLVNVSTGWDYCSEKGKNRENRTLPFALLHIYFIHCNREVIYTSWAKLIIQKKGENSCLGVLTERREKVVMKLWQLGSNKLWNLTAILWNLTATSNMSLYSFITNVPISN